MAKVEGYTTEFAFVMEPYTEVRSRFALMLFGREGWWTPQRRHLFWLPGNQLLSLADADAYVIVNATIRGPAAAMEYNQNVVGHWLPGTEVHTLVVGVIEDRVPVQVLVERLMELERLPLM